MQFNRYNCQGTTRQTTEKPKKTAKFRESSLGQTDKPEDIHEEEPKYSTRPLGGRAKRTKVNIDVFVTEEVAISDQEIDIYVVVDHTANTKTLYRTEEEVQIPKEYQEFKDIFTPAPVRQLPEHGTYDHKIKLKEGGIPKFIPIYQLNKTQKKLLREYIDENLKKGYIEPSKSPVGYPILFVIKKNEDPTKKIRIYIDYR